MLERGKESKREIIEDEEGKGSETAMVVAQMQAKLKEIDTKVKSWMKLQPAPVEVAIVTVASSLQGGFIGGMMGTLTSDMTSTLPPPPGPITPEAAATMSKMKALAGGPWSQARNFAVMTGVNAGITAAMKRARGGVDDVQTNMAAAFGSGLAFSLVSGMGGPNPATNAVTTGIFFALIQGGIYKVGQQFSQPSTDDQNYVRTKGMLSNLGLQKYEKNFKRGLLTDQTLPLLNDRALQEVKIPAGPRLLILDHVKEATSSPAH